LVEVKFAHRFINDISSPEVSLATYSNNKDEFLYGSLTDFIKQVYLTPNKLNTGLKINNMYTIYIHRNSKLSGWTNVEEQNFKGLAHI
jgi:hypothetical protein